MVMNRNELWGLQKPKRPSSILYKIKKANLTLLNLTPTTQKYQKVGTIKTFRDHFLLGFCEEGRMD